jgi:hypothetical protein
VTAPPNAGGERDQLGLWLRVVLGLGIGLYFGWSPKWVSAVKNSVMSSRGSAPPVRR